MSVTADVRPARPNDIEALVVMCDEHARYEGAPYRRAGKAKALSRALFSATSRLHGWVADAAGELTGYATAAWEFSTWQGGEFLHMDCLFVREGWRDQGVGAALLHAVSDFARRSGCAEIQWQTPGWNEDAARFYRRAGAMEKPKRRFSLAVA
ncbi:MAG TPA: GNAT family N-acetyltransferase [Rhodanobacter sp.]|nr:GNAT family N-acetyltransferase [Rhodanobacter sp.]